MKRERMLWVLSLLTLAAFSATACSTQADKPATATVTAQVQSPPADATPVSNFHHSKSESTSLAENVLWDYFGNVNNHNINAVMEVLSDELRTAYEPHDNIVYRNFKSAKVKQIYDITDQFPKNPNYVEAHYFYVEVEYQTNHLYDSNDTDGMNYRMAIVARDKQNAPYKLYELSHTPRLQEVSADTPDDPNTNIGGMPQNPAQLYKP